MYFCYDCRLSLPGVFTPHVKLPCDVDIIKHPSEKNSKSSAIHCKIVAPEQTRVMHMRYCMISQIPDVNYKLQVLVFPSPSAISVEEYVRTKGPIKRIVVLDCTWFQVHMMQKLPQIQGLPCVSLSKYRTAFWRPQHNVDESGLATIEAIYYALREYQEYGLKKPYEGEFDDLLYWFFLSKQHVDKKQEEYHRKVETNKTEESSET
ncbi:DTW domain protein [Oesophagostomum dentatum]|uniref:tRNA-uridine aminocarboxypropyltransferase 1 n=1 Tax=Oesophagostomum dentatum TaxID=61180 RepID=A0A0B1SLK5_OESDE|nr:DTW domain protein [Oesophagostomum dentatum]